MQTQTNRRPLPPATGGCTWINHRPDIRVSTLRITVQTTRGPLTGEYQVEFLPNGSYRMYTIVDDKLRVYQLDANRHPGTLFCDCPDSQNRPERAGQCKHSRALRAALPYLPF